jgi:hypothetical protein
MLLTDEQVTQARTMTADAALGMPEPASLRDRMSQQRDIAARVRQALGLPDSPDVLLAIIVSAVADTYRAVRPLPH